ncbi:enolase C-terminal domain-like protein, partial [Mycobacterium avium]|uniref:enolase C-terminal domain-like protein n=1 Tax=Mycobacterium avium TaxID=1764 RepID=UPI000AF01562
GPDTELYVDANGGYRRKQAIRMTHAMAGHDVTWFEEPVSSDDLAGLREVRDQVSADVTAGEYGYDSQHPAQPARGDRPHTLCQPLDQEPGSYRAAHGEFDDTPHAHTPQLWASQHPVISATGALGAAGLGAWLAAGARRWTR